MTTDINLLRHRLETEWQRLMQELKGLKAMCPAGERRVSRWAKEDEFATEISGALISGALEKLTKDLLAEVGHALHKFDQGTYGFCDNCGQGIDPARLEALPQANLCLNCKAREEGRKRQGSPGSAYKETKARYYSVDALLEYYERVWEQQKEGQKCFRETGDEAVV